MKGEHWPKTYRGPESGIPFLCCLFCRFEDMIKVTPTERVENEARWRRKKFHRKEVVA